MIVLFSCVTALLIVLNTVLSINTELRALQTHEQETLTVVSQQISSEIEENLAFMEYGIDSLAQNNAFMEALSTIDSLGEEGAHTTKYTEAQNTLSTYLYHEPLNDRFYSINVITNSGFILSSHFQKFELIESYSDELMQQMNLMSKLMDGKVRLNSKQVITPHPDPWDIYHSGSKSISVYSMWSNAIYHGKNIGYLEVNALTSDLKSIFEIPAMDDFLASGIYKKRTTEKMQELYRGSNDTIQYTDITPGVMTTCVDKDGVNYYVVSAYNKNLDLTIYAAQRTDEYTASVHTAIRSHFLTGLLVLIITILLIVVLSFSLTRSIHKLTGKIAGISKKTLVEVGQLGSNALRKVTSKRDQEVRILEDSFDEMLQALQTSTQTEIQLRESTLRAQLNALQAQINPHFIYNTLNIIAAKSMETGNEAVIDICDHFAQMLRYSTDLRSKTATLREEIENAKNYLLLAKFRYEDKLTYTINVPDCFLQKVLPKLSLQPIVENAISHGYQGSHGDFSIAISGEIDEAGSLHLTIRDNGCGFDEFVLLRLRHEFDCIEKGELSVVENTGAHIGLVNTYRRLYYFSDKRIKMLLCNDNGAVVEMIITQMGKES
jgi:two-component system sensor histidine kinase YesM